MTTADGHGLPSLIARAEVHVDVVTELDPTAPFLVPGAGSTLNVPGVARFVVAPDGGTVHVSHLLTTDLDLVHGWLFGSVAALVLAHRGLFALHACAVQVDGVCIAVTGVSGAGKSTTALRLAQRGHRLLSDDVCPVSTVDGQPVLEPLGRPIHVWPATATALGVDLTDARPLWQGAAKLQLPAPSAPPAVLKAVVLLRPSPVPHPILRPLEGPEALAALAANVYRHELVASRWGPQMLAWAGVLSRSVRVFTVDRPEDRWSVEEVADAVEALDRSERARLAEHPGACGRAGAL